MISLWRKTALAAAVAVAGGFSLDAAPASWTLTTATAPWVTAPLVETMESGAHGVEIDPSRPLQAMTGFGGCFNELGWTALQTLPAAAVDQVPRDLFSPQGCNFGLCRMPIGANDYAVSWYSLDETPGDTALAHFSLDRDEVFLLPYIRAATKVRPDLQVWGSAWSPPAWMKTGGTYHGGSLRWEKPVLEAYAAYLRDLAQIHLEPLAGAERAAPACGLVAIDTVFRCQRRDLLRRTGRFPGGTRRQAVGGERGTGEKRGEHEAQAHGVGHRSGVHGVYLRGGHQA